MEKRNVIILVLTAAVILFSVLAFVSRPPSLTALATESTTTSSVTVQKFLAITLSTNLSDGITFGTVDTLPGINVNASDNDNDGSSGTSLFVNVSTDSNTAVDFCTKANSGLHDAVGDSTIGLSNETYRNASTTNSTLPGPATSSIPLTTSFVKASEPTVPGNVTYYRFWLDVPTGTASGTYNNTVTFKGVETTLSC